MTETTPTQLLIVGEGEVATALREVARLLGWRPVLVDSAGAARDAARELGPSDAAVVTSHHDGVDGPALEACLHSEAAYVGGMGSRRTQARRAQWLLEHGVPQEAVDSIHGPAGLDIGADTPAEIAVSIISEAVAVLRGAHGGASLRDRSGAIHPDLPPGTVYCPTG